ncbi:hypothetical protein, partial [Brevibacillus sp. HD1.4A]|uniref:hypothetical protein n=1 Tax=Brevibacillus sp. HD1.4A TaxID=2738978 RepID=UPI001C2B83D7
AGSRPVVRSIDVLGSLTRSGFTLEEHQRRVSRALPIWLVGQEIDEAAPVEARPVDRSITCALSSAG